MAVLSLLRAKALIQETTLAGKDCRVRTKAGRFSVGRCCRCSGEKPFRSERIRAMAVSLLEKSSIDANRTRIPERERLACGCEVIVESRPWTSSYVGLGPP